MEGFTVNPLCMQVVKLLVTETEIAYGRKVQHEVARAHFELLPQQSV